MEVNKIYCEDCFEGMKRLPDKSFDMILTDPPYGCLNRERTHAKQSDQAIDLEAMWSQFNRLIKDNGAMVVFGAGRFGVDLIKANENLFRYDLVWDKRNPTGFLNANKMPMRIHENIFVFYKKLPTYNPQMTFAGPHKRNHSKGRLDNVLVNNCYGNFVNTPTVISDEKFPTSIISFTKGSPTENSHPSQKPISLMSYLIRTYTNRGGLVLDPFMGSGSTAVACVQEGRRFVGFEFNRKYYDIAIERLKGTSENLF